MIFAPGVRMENCDLESEELFKLKVVLLSQHSVASRWIKALSWKWLMLYPWEVHSTFTTIQGIELFSSSCICPKHIAFCCYLIVSDWHVQSQNEVLNIWRLKFKSPFKLTFSLRCLSTAWLYLGYRGIIRTKKEFQLE